MRLQARVELQWKSISRTQAHVRTAGTQWHTTRTIATSPRAFAASPSPKKPSQPPPPPPPRSTKPSTEPSDPIANFAAQVRKRETFKSTTEPYIAYGSTEDLFRECSAQCSYTVPSLLKQPPEPAPKNSIGEDIGEGETDSFWYRSKDSGGLGLDVTFNTWAQVCFLHMYMLTVRLRCFPAEHARVWHQNLLDHFFYAAEDRMAVWHGMSARGTRNKYLKDLWLQWRGVVLSCDEGLVKGDAVLAGAVWRNVFKGGEEVDVEGVAVVTAYVRSRMAMLGEMSDERLAGGEVRFGEPVKLRGLVEGESPWMKRKVTEVELKGKES